LSAPQCKLLLEPLLFGSINSHPFNLLVIFTVHTHRNVASFQMKERPLSRSAIRGNNLQRAFLMMQLVSVDWRLPTH
jgi:hypothetical protein